MTVLMANRITINLRKHAYQTPIDESTLDHNIQFHVRANTIRNRRTNPATTLQQLGSYQPDEMELGPVKTVEEVYV